MANEKEPTPGTRGARIDQIRKDLDLTREKFAERLAKAAQSLGIVSGGRWSPTRVSKLTLGRQPISLDDAAVVMSVDPKKRGWQWFVLGVETVIPQGKPADMPNVELTPTVRASSKKVPKKEREA